MNIIKGKLILISGSRVRKDDIVIYKDQSSKNNVYKVLEPSDDWLKLLSQDNKIEHIPLKDIETPVVQYEYLDNCDEMGNKKYETDIANISSGYHDYLFRNGYKEQEISFVFNRRNEAVFYKQD